MNAICPAIRVFAAVLVNAITCICFAHDGPAGHQHSNLEDENAAGVFTTRDSPLSLPLAKQEDAFHFVVYGDRTGGVPAGLKVLEQAVVDTNLLDPDLVMTVGDLIQGYNDTPEWLQQMADYKAIMDRLNMRWFPVAGNHDVYWRGLGKAPTGQHESNYEKHFGPLWYSFEHKNANFIVLYSDEGDATTNEKGFNSGRLQTMSDAQLAFLKQSLEKNKSLAHQFVFLHHPRWIGAGYTDGNWDTVHQMLKDAGNVSAVFAGHIHHMRFDGPKDGIAYYTLATTGGSLSAEIPDAGFLHHLNVVTVRRESVTVAALPIGAVIDPKDFTPEFLAEIDKARAVRPVESANNVLMQTDGSANGDVTFTLANTSSQAIDVTASMETLGRDWVPTLDHDHFRIEAGETKQLRVGLHRYADLTAELTTPQIRLDIVYVGQTARIALPLVITPISFDLAAVPADYFTNSKNHCLQVDSERSAARIASDEFNLPQGPFTLEAWIRPQQSPGQRGVVAKTENSEYAIFMDEGVPQFDVHLSGRYVMAKAKDVLINDRWTHIAGVFDGSEVRLYVDGKIVASQAGRGKRTTNELPLFIGADTSDSGQPTRAFLGSVDEVRLSGRAIYEVDFTPQKRLPPTTDTLLLFNLDQRLGPFVLDRSPTAAKAVLGAESKLMPVADLAN